MVYRSAAVYHHILGYYEFASAPPHVSLNSSSSLCLVELQYCIVTNPFAMTNVPAGTRPNYTGIIIDYSYAW